MIYLFCGTALTMITLILSENLLQAFKIKSINDEIFKSRVPQVFYFLSIILLLSTLFFVFRSKT